MNTSETLPVFSTKDEEIDFWKSQADDLKIKLAESREELDEFRENSRELEAELEAQLEQQEERSRDLTNRLSRIQTDNQQLKERLDRVQQETHSEISDLQSDLGQVNSVCDRLNKYVRELEQQNDDLERSKRTLVVSLEDFESRLNQALERNAFLESELDEKEGLRDVVQRLKDECRDLRQELAVKQRNNTTADNIWTDNSNCSEAGVGGSTVANQISTAADSNKLSDANKRASLPVVPATSNIPAKLSLSERSSRSVDISASSKTPPRHLQLITTSQDASAPAVNSSTCSGMTAISPGSKISALNIVGDLLRKVGALESKLAMCKSYVRDSGSNPISTGNSVKHTTNMRESNRSLPLAARKSTKIPTHVHN